MAKYTWDKRLLTNYMLDPINEKEFTSAFSYIDTKQKTEPKKLSPLRVMSKNCNFFTLNSFVLPVFESLINPMPDYVRVPKTHLHISISRALKLTNAFYASTDQEIYNAFRIVFKQRFKNLMSTDKRENKGSDYIGHTFFSENAKSCLIQFDATRDIKMLLVLIHEYAHAMGFVLRDYRDIYGNNFVTQEVESIFMELLAHHWLQENTNFGNEAYIEKVKTHNAIIQIICDVIEANELANMVRDMHSQGQNITMKTIYYQAQREFENMSEKDIKELLKVPIENHIPYAYSGLIAIELFQLYLQNPKEAFELFKIIVKTQKETAEATDIAIKQLGITAGEHFEDFSRSLKR